MLTLSRSLAPRNLLTVAEWRRFAQAVGLRSWKGGVRRYVEQSGAALVLASDDRLIVFARHAGGRVSQKTYKRGEWRFA